MLIEKKVRVEEVESQNDIKKALEATLYVPDEKVRPKIIEEYLAYLASTSKDEQHDIKTLVAFQGEEPEAMASCHDHPDYTSYGRKCGAIGWLSAEKPDAMAALMTACETFFLERKLHKIRTGINFPKSLGGLGFQVSGFGQPMLYGVGFSSPERNEITFLQQIGFEVESEYTCLKVSKKTWQKAGRVDDDIRFEYVPVSRMKEKAVEVQALAEDSFQGLLPDTSGGRFAEFIHAFEQMPPVRDMLRDDIDPSKMSANKAFLKAWESCDLENITPLMPMAYDKTTGEMVGILLGLPDLYQHWAGEKITRVNVDTAIVRKGYKGRGIFSALNNIGQLTCGFYGMTYFEGTTVWTGNSRGVNNTDAISSIMPHCTPIRKHVVLQKRLKLKKK